MQTNQLPLNAGQQAAADGVFQFLMGNEKELIISGPGGTGKTFLMGHLIDSVIPRYHDLCSLMNIPELYDTVVMTAMTNKAAETLGIATGRPVQSLHSWLRLTVKENYTTGATFLSKSPDFKVNTGVILFIDEAYMIDDEIYRFIHDGTMNCKIIYVGDHCQLAPVMSERSAIENKKIPFFELTEPMRNADQPALQALCSQLRDTVETGIFLPIQTVPGVITLLDDNTMPDKLEEYFLNQTKNTRVLAYTNAQVTKYNAFIHELRQKPALYSVGDELVNNTAIRVTNGRMRVEEQVTITKVGITQIMQLSGENGSLIDLEVVLLDLKGPYATYTEIAVPTDKDYYTQVLKFYSSRKRWREFFNLKNTIPDLRPRDAATVHKAQGSTHDSVFIDMADLSMCRNPSLAARLMYVAASRAKSEIFMYGQLALKFGGYA